MHASATIYYNFLFFCCHVDVMTRTFIFVGCLVLKCKKNLNTGVTLKYFLVTETAPPICEVSKIEQLRNRLKTDIPLHDLESLNDTATLAKNVCTIVDQIKHLRTAIENTIELSKIKSNKAEGLYECKYFFYIYHFVH